MFEVGSEVLPLFRCIVGLKGCYVPLQVIAVHLVLLDGSVTVRPIHELGPHFFKNFCEQVSARYSLRHVLVLNTTSQPFKKTVSLHQYLFDT